MIIRHAILAFAIVSASVCAMPAALAQEPEEHQGVRQEAHEAKETVKQDAHAVKQEVRDDAHAVKEAVKEDAHEVRAAAHRSAHWRRYHVCTRTWHGHCTRWARRYHHG